MGMRGHAHTRRRTPWSIRSSTWTALGDVRGLPNRHLAAQLVKFVQTTPQDQPFFAMYSPTTPHMPSDDPRYEPCRSRHRAIASFDDDTVRDTAPLYARRPALTETRSRTPTSATRGWHTASARWTTRYATILNGLGDRARDTLVIYLSDNGFLFGEHRRFGKTDAYEDPFACRW